ncbi:MAG: hypothetical protein JWM36_767 [Hyphomicrobiales bacterium]|nr:hypothetical protein [Hyphomicrobiales bacterium]
MKPSSSIGLAFVTAVFSSLFLLGNSVLAANSPGMGGRPAMGGNFRPPGQRPVINRPLMGGHHHGRRPPLAAGFVVPGGLGPYYYGDGYQAPGGGGQQILVQPVVTQSQVVYQTVAPEPYGLRCGGPKVIHLRPERRASAAPRVIYGSPDPCGANR